MMEDNRAVGNGESGKDTGGAVRPVIPPLSERPAVGTAEWWALVPEEYRDQGRYKATKNGAVMDTIKGGIVYGSLIETKITASNSIDMRARANENAMQARLAARSGLAAAMKSKSALGGWAKLIEKQAGLAADTDRGMSSVKAAELVGRATGFLEKDVAGAQASADVALEVITALVSRLQPAPVRQDASIPPASDVVIDAESTDIEY